MVRGKRFAPSYQSMAKSGTRRLLIFLCCISKKFGEIYKLAEYRCRQRGFPPNAEKLLNLGGRSSRLLDQGPITDAVRDDALWRTGHKGQRAHILREIMDTFGVELADSQLTMGSRTHDAGTSTDEGLRLDTSSSLVETDAGIVGGSEFHGSEENCAK